MGRMITIPEKLHQQVMNWTAEGKKSYIIANLLEIDYGIKCSQETVSRLIRKIRLERQEAASAAYTEEIEKTANSDVKIMSDVVSTFYKDLQTCQDPVLKLKIAAELRMWVKDKMSIANLNLEDKSNSQEIKDELLEELEELREIKKDTAKSN